MNKGIIQPSVSISEDWKAAATTVYQHCGGPENLSAHLDAALITPGLAGLDIVTSAVVGGADSGAGEQDIESCMEMYFHAFGEKLTSAQYLFVLAHLTEVVQSGLCLCGQCLVACKLLPCSD